MMSDRKRQESLSNSSDRNSGEDNIDTLDAAQCSSTQQQSVIEVQAQEFEVSIANKRWREEDDMEWTTVGRKGKKAKDENNKIEVYVSSTEKLPKQFSLAKLFKEEGIDDTIKIKYMNPYRMRIEFNNDLSAEKFMKCDKFISMGWRIVKSMEVGYSYGIIKNVDLELSEEQILEDIVCPSPAELVSLKRLNRRHENGEGWIPCETVRLCFKGHFLPAHVFVGNLKINVDKYVFPVTQCSRCWKIGHPTKKCASKVVCPKCSGDHANCDTNKLKCPNCGGEHMALFKECPTYKKERKIRLIMSEFNCTYRKALTMYPTESITNSPPRSNRVLAQTSTDKPTEEYPLTPSFADVIKVSPQMQPHKSKSTTRKQEKPKSKNIENKFNFKNWEFTRSDAESESSNAENTSNPRRPTTKISPDSNVTISELVGKLKKVIFSKRDSISVKIQCIVKLCIEWLTIWVIGNISEWSLFKRLFEFSLASNNGPST